MYFQSVFQFTMGEKEAKCLLTLSLSDFASSSNISFPCVRVTHRVPLKSSYPDGENEAEGLSGSWVGEADLPPPRPPPASERARFRTSRHVGLSSGFIFLR